jgi:hypothetical protein
LRLCSSARRRSRRAAVESEHADPPPAVDQLASMLADELGWRTSHAMRAANNVVTDVRVTDYAVSDQAVPAAIRCEGY